MRGFIDCLYEDQAGAWHVLDFKTNQVDPSTLAAVAGDRQALVAETADLLFHLLVVLQVRGVTLADVYAELERRTARSGIDEKESRSR